VSSGRPGRVLVATTANTDPGHDPRATAWRVVSAIEATAAAFAVILDLTIPSLVLIAMAAASLMIRRQGVATLGLRRFSGWGLVGKTFAFAVLWSLFQFTVTMPVANHVSGTRQDLSAFEDLQGNVGMLAALLVAGWLLGAFAEELAYRGYLLTRIHDAFGDGRVGLLVAVLASSVLFGIAHSEQGLVGVLIVTIDGIYFSLLRLHYQTLWASILAHGFNNTIGFIAFFMVGPLYGAW
jgi:CAAX protease family protein